jgi:hypothetical protein
MFDLVLLFTGLQQTKNLPGKNPLPVLEPSAFYQISAFSVNTFFENSLGAEAGIGPHEMLDAAKVSPDRSGVTRPRRRSRGSGRWRNSVERVAPARIPV